MNPNHSPYLNGFIMTGKREITLAGTQNEVKILGEQLLSQRASLIPLYVPDDAPSPYDGYLVNIQLVNTHGPVQIGLAERTLVIAGAPEGRRMFAASVLKSASEVDEHLQHMQNRLQIKYAPDHPFLASAALTVNIDIIDLGSEAADLTDAEPRIRLSRRVKGGPKCN